MSTHQTDPPPSAESAPADLLKDLAEALTALGNYVAAAHRIVAAITDGRRELLDETLQKALDQQERSAVALRRLRSLF